jgi:hypothetical protein
MKHYELPEDVDFPELDEATKAWLDEEHAHSLELMRGAPFGDLEVTCFPSDFLRSLPDKNRAMYKYIWLRHVREYEEYMRQHPELDKD